MATPNWPQIEKACLSYLEKPTEKRLSSIESLLTRASGILDSIANFFIRKHATLEDTTVVFCNAENGDYPEWGCQFNAETRQFLINPVGVFRFIKECQQSKEAMFLPMGRGSFSIYRLNAFKTQLCKLPSQMMMFLLLFKEVANTLQVAYEERRKGSKNETSQIDIDYTNFLWGFKELERLYLCVKGVELKSDLQFVWHETEWTSGRN